MANAKICPRCKSENNPNFSVCWSCKASIASGVIELKQRAIKGYAFFDMCPFAMAQVGGGGGIGFDIESYTWTHVPCIREHCRLWTYKYHNGEKYADGCSLQFVGMTMDDIKHNIEERDRVIKQTI